MDRFVCAAEACPFTFRFSVSCWCCGVCCVFWGSLRLGAMSRTPGDLGVLELYDIRLSFLAGLLSVCDSYHGVSSQVRVPSFLRGLLLNGCVI